MYFKLKIKFRKFSSLKYLSQLDFMRLLARALRRAQLPVYLTQGFSQRIKLSFGRASKIGKEAEEEVTFYFTEKVSYFRLKEELGRQLPYGIEILGEINGQ